MSVARIKKEIASGAQSLEDIPEIPQEEQPYPLPEGWKWVNLLNSFHNKTDSKKKLQQKYYGEIGKFAVVDQGKDLIGGYSDNSGLVYRGDLPVIIFGDHTRCIKYVDFKFIQGADGIKVLLPKKNILPKYFFYALQNIQFTDLGYRRHFPVFRNFYIPVAPLETQHRIVNRIEPLFSRLDEAAEKARAVIDSHEARKQAILHKAFSGELTRDVVIKEEELYKDISEIPQEEQPYPVPEGWKWVKLKYVIELISGRDSKLSECNNKHQGIPYLLGASNFLNNNVTIERWIVKPVVISKKGDVLITVKGTIGKLYIQAEDQINISRQIMALRTSDIVYNKYLYHYFSLNKDELVQLGNGLIPGIPREILLNLNFPLPPLENQRRIVERVESLFSKLDESNAVGRNILERIDGIKKAILAMAFSGKF